MIKLPKIIRKDFEGKFIISCAAQRADGWCESAQTVLMIWFLSWPCERFTVINEARSPRYRLGFCLESESDSSLPENNQGGTANVDSSLRPKGLRDLLF